jgi:glycerol-3-phosphate dehydrogenase
MGIAEWVRDALVSGGLDLAEPAADGELRMPNIGEFGTRPYQDAELIGRDPDHGRIVCFCERVTRGEIDAALASPIPPVDADGLRRRTRAVMGRCQGFFCGAEIAATLEADRGD